MEKLIFTRDKKQDANTLKNNIILFNYLYTKDNKTPAELKTFYEIKHIIIQYLHLMTI